MTYILLVILIALVGYNIFLNIQQKRKREKEEMERELERKRLELLQQAALQEAAKKKDLPMVPANQLIKDLLTELKCEVTVKETADNKEQMEFTYQGGHFSVSASTKNGGFRLGYLFFFSTPAQKLEQVRKLVNTLNNQTLLTRFTYSFEEAENKVFVHQLLSSMLVAGMPGLADYWKTLLDSCFEHRRIFTQQFGEQDNKDEQLVMKTHRLLFLLREHEIDHQEYAGRSRASEEDPFTLQQFVDTALDMPDADLIRLKVVTDQLEVLHDSTSINSYQLQQALIAGQGQEVHFINQDVQLVLTLTNPGNKSARQQTISIMLHAEKATDNALYFRVSYCIPSQSISKDTSMMDKSNVVDAKSILMAYDKMDWHDKRAEAEYMWNEAVEKAQEGTQTMSPEEEMLISSTFNNDNYLLYWGRKAFMEKRYYETIFYLKKVFNNLQAVFHELKKDDIRVFFEICYYLGYCYNDLKQYEKGNYFLNMVFSLHRVTYTQEFINGLTMSGDFRALPTIDMLLNNLQNSQEQAEDDEEDEQGYKLDSDVQTFINFLRRRKAYILVDRGEYDQAEKEYKELLKDPESEQFALRELAYIQHVRKEEEAE